LGLDISEEAELARVSPAVHRGEPSEIDWNSFPVKEMYRRGWFEGFSGSAAAAMAVADSLAEAFVTSVIRRPAVALHRKRVRCGSAPDMYALMAWECRILALAEKSPAKGTYSQGSLDSAWFKAIVGESRHPDGPTRARDCLGEAGISLVIEPHLPHTYLDGAAILHGGKPVVGLTLRYDRLDNFWFVLVHELMHVAKHLRKGRVDCILDDMEAEPDEFEREADALTAEELIPERDWETALARYVRSDESVNSLAEQLGISPAIVAGRIRNEANDFVILKDMIGQGEVRRQFPDVRFGW